MNKKIIELQNDIVKIISNSAKSILVTNKLIEILGLIVEDCGKVADGHRCELGRSDHQDQQDITAYLIGGEIRELIE